MAEAIEKEASSRSLKLLKPSGFEATPGKGVKAKVQGKDVLLGNRKPMIEIGVDLSGIEEKIEECEEDGKTVMFLAIKGKLAGAIAAADTLKEHVTEAIAALRSMGIEVIMLTGDNERTAKAIARKLGIEKVIAEVLPEQKEAVIDGLQKEGKIVAMVGDGINDAQLWPRLT